VIKACEAGDSRIIWTNVKRNGLSPASRARLHFGS